MNLTGRKTLETLSIDSQENIFNTFGWAEDDTTNTRYPNDNHTFISKSLNAADLTYYPYGNNNTKIIDKNAYTGKIYKEGNELKSQNLDFPYRQEYNGYKIEGKRIGNVVFTDLSTEDTWVYDDEKQILNNRPNPIKTTSTIISNRSESELANIFDGLKNVGDYPLDCCNKCIGILFINWNGVIIDRADYDTSNSGDNHIGRDKIVYDTSEFIEIINKLTTKIYHNIIKLEKDQASILHGRLEKVENQSNENGTVTLGNLTAEDSSIIPNLVNIIQRLCNINQANIVKLRNETIAFGGTTKEGNENIYISSSSQTLNYSNESDTCLPDLLDVVRGLCNVVYNNISYLRDKTITHGGRSGQNDSIFISNTALTLNKFNPMQTVYQLLNDICDVVYDNISYLRNKTITHGGRSNQDSVLISDNSLTLDKSNPIQTVYQLLNDICDVVYNNISYLRSKTITHGGRSNQDSILISDNSLTLNQSNPMQTVYQLLNDICDVVYNNITVENGRRKTCEDAGDNINHLKRTLVKNAELTMNGDSYHHEDICAIPTTITPELGENWDIIYTNNTDSTLTVTINNYKVINDTVKGKVTLNNSDYRFRVPDGQSIELIIPPGGYCELNYLRIDSIETDATVKYLYVRGA